MAAKREFVIQKKYQAVEDENYSWPVTWRDLEGGFLDTASAMRRLSEIAEPNETYRVSQIKTDTLTMKPKQPEYTLGVVEDGEVEDE